MMTPADVREAANLVDRLEKVMRDIHTIERHPHGVDLTITAQSRRNHHDVLTINCPLGSSYRNGVVALLRAEAISMRSQLKNMGVEPPEEVE